MYLLRKAVKKDELKIMNLVSLVLSDYGLKTNPQVTDKDLSDLEHYYFNNKGWFAVIEIDNEIVGSYGICKIDTQTCELRKMYLKSDFQGQGLGRLMIENAIQRAKELGYTTIVLETNKLLDKAISIYKKYGFVEYCPEHLSDRCDLAMKKEL
jgi:putative acetyltransferase